MRRNDDGDIKLFVTSSDKDAAKNESDSEIIAVAKALDAQRSNGNLRKVEIIGKKLYNLLTLDTDEFKDVFNIDASDFLDSKLRYEMRVLMIFTAQVTLHSVLPQVLSTQAVNSMYHYIRKNEGEFYDSLMECTSFSLYYLAIRNRVNIEGDISSSFAALCMKEDDKQIVELGHTLFVEMGKYVKELTKDIEL